MTKMFCDCCGKEINESDKFTMAVQFSLQIKNCLRQMILQFHEMHGVSPSQDICRQCVISKSIDELASRIRNPKAIITPPTKGDPGQSTEGIQWAEMLRKNAEEAIHKLADELHKEQDKLTREQFREALLQAIKSGDFAKHIRLTSFPIYDTQKHEHQEVSIVDYVPFRRVQELERQIELMKRPCDKCGQVMSELSGEDA